MPADQFGVISPHPPIFIPAVGGAQAAEAQDSIDALKLAGAAVARFAPQLIVLISPHAPSLRDAFLIDDFATLTGTLEQFGDLTEYTRPGHPQFAAALTEYVEAAGLPAVARSQSPSYEPGWLDHASIVPLYFLEPSGSVPTVVVSLSGHSYAEHRLLGACVSRLATQMGLRTAFVASGDLSHRLAPRTGADYSPLAAALDGAIVERVLGGQFSDLANIEPSLVREGGECGLRSIVALGGFAGEDPVPTRVLAYEGPWGVGYLTALVGSAAVAGITPPPGATADPAGGATGLGESEIVRLARATIERVVRGEDADIPEPLTDPALPARAGAFVSLHRNGQLRGCIGTIGPARATLAQEVVANAVEAALYDPRFPAVTPDELADLDVKVDVLQPPENCTLAELDPKEYGVVVTHGGRRGLLLPDLEGVDDIATQVDIAMRKAGIPPGTACDLQRFKVDRYT